MHFLIERLHAVLHAEGGEDGSLGSSSCATGTPNTAITASPMNFSTVPPNRSISSTIASKNGRSTPRRSSGSSRVAISVDPLRSAKITVTTLRSSGVTPADARPPVARGSQGPCHMSAEAERRRPGRAARGTRALQGRPACSAEPQVRLGRGAAARAGDLVHRVILPSEAGRRDVDRRSRLRGRAIVARQAAGRCDLRCVMKSCSGSQRLYPRAKLRPP